jgi:hypothetical protein
VTQNSKVKPGRKPTKFTPERLEQIRCLVERGTRREEIATLLDVSLGSLQVTCSKLGISLRQPNSNGSLPSRGERNGVTTSSPGLGADLSSPANRQTEFPALQEQAQPPQPGKRHETNSMNLAVTIRYKNEERVTKLALTPAMITQVALEAHFRNLRIHELVGDLITVTLKKDLVQQLLDNETVAK